MASVPGFPSQFLGLSSRVGQHNPTGAETTLVCLLSDDGAEAVSGQGGSALRVHTVFKSVLLVLSLHPRCNFQVPW